MLEQRQIHMLVVTADRFHSTWKREEFHPDMYPLDIDMDLYDISHVVQLRRFTRAGSVIILVPSDLSRFKFVSMPHLLPSIQTIMLTGFSMPPTSQLHFDPFELGAFPSPGIVRSGSYPRIPSAPAML